MARPTSRKSPASPQRGAAAQRDEPVSRERKAIMLQRLLQLQNRLLTPFNAHMQKRYNISANEFRIFMTLGRMGEGAAHEIAEVTGLSTMTVSRAIASLERAGRVTVRRNEANKRSNILTLSKEGEALFKEMLPVSGQVADYLFGGMTAREINAFGSRVDAMIARLKVVDDEGRSTFLEATRPRKD